MVGLGTDGAANMRGKVDSVVQKFKKEIPLLISVHCFDHCFALIAEKSSEKLPEKVEKLLRKVYNYFARSPKRINEYEKV